MVDQILFDKLIYIDRLKRAGIGEEQARAHANAMEDALRESTATKADLRNTTIELKSDIAGVEARLTMLTWIVGIHFAMTLAGFGLMFNQLLSISAKLP